MRETQLRKERALGWWHILIITVELIGYRVEYTTKHILVTCKPNTIIKK